MDDDVYRRVQALLVDPSKIEFKWSSEFEDALDAWRGLTDELREMCELSLTSPMTAPPDMRSALVVAQRLLKAAAR